MLYLLFIYIHLIATCMAIGVIVLTDMRLLAKLVGYRVVIPPPEQFETLMVVVAMTTLVVSGCAVVLLGMAANPHYLNNPKLQAKILLVGLIVANSFALHYISFPRLARARAVASWKARDHLGVAIPVALSNSLWLYCAFLGVARPWNNVVPIGTVLAIAFGLFVAATLAVLLALRFGAREQHRERPDWIDSVKARLSDRMPLSERRRYDRQHLQDTLF
ncbi:MAG TPA: hypothetical protein VGM74_11910 [Burkholderiaceae bacterium]|jgi:hypothetical protein